MIIQTKQKWSMCDYMLYSILLFVLERKWGGCVPWNHVNKRKEKKKDKNLYLIAVVASPSLPALSTHTAYTVLTQQCCCQAQLPGPLEDKEMQGLFCMNHMTKLYYACFKGAAKWGLLLCLQNKRVQKEVPAPLNPLSNCWVTEEVAAETKTSCKISTVTEQLLKHLLLIK